VPTASTRQIQAVARRTIGEANPRLLDEELAGHRLIAVGAYLVVLPEGARHFRPVVTCSRCTTPYIAHNRPVLSAADLEAAGEQAVCERCASPGVIDVGVANRQASATPSPSADTREAVLAVLRRIRRDRPEAAAVDTQRTHAEWESAIIDAPRRVGQGPAGPDEGPAAGRPPPPPSPPPPAAPAPAPTAVSFDPAPLLAAVDAFRSDVRRALDAAAERVDRQGRELAGRVDALQRAVEAVAARGADPSSLSPGLERALEEMAARAADERQALVAQVTDALAVAASQPARPPETDPVVLAELETVKAELREAWRAVAKRADDDRRELQARLEGVAAAVRQSADVAELLAPVERHVEGVAEAVRQTPDLEVVVGRLQNRFDTLRDDLRDTMAGVAREAAAERRALVDRVEALADRVAAATAAVDPTPLMAAVDARLDRIAAELREAVGAAAREAAEERRALVERVEALGTLAGPVTALAAGLAEVGGAVREAAEERRALLERVEALAASVPADPPGLATLAAGLAEVGGAVREAAEERRALLERVEALAAAMPADLLAGLGALAGLPAQLGALQGEVREALAGTAREAAVERGMVLSRIDELGDAAGRQPDLAPLVDAVEGALRSQREELGAALAHLADEAAGRHAGVVERLEALAAKVRQSPDALEVLELVEAQGESVKADLRAAVEAVGTQVRRAVVEPGTDPAEALERVAERLRAELGDDRAAATQEAAQARSQLQAEFQTVLAAANRWFVGVRDEINARLDRLAAGGGPPPAGDGAGPPVGLASDLRDLQLEVSAMGQAVLELRSAVQELAAGLAPPPAPAPGRRAAPKATATRTATKPAAGRAAAGTKKAAPSRTATTAAAKAVTPRKRASASTSKAPARTTAARTTPARGSATGGRTATGRSRSS
jgi:chromosome segregation ATPase